MKNAIQIDHEIIFSTQNIQTVKTFKSEEKHTSYGVAYYDYITRFDITYENGKEFSFHITEKNDKNRPKARTVFNLIWGHEEN